jgi:ABC-type Fe3+ transport system permease subunit
MNSILKVFSMPHFAGASCGGGGFLDFPTWYAYLSGTTTTPGGCTPELTKLTDVWLVVAAVIEILLRLAAIAAVGIIIYAGIQYTTSSGNPNQTSRALNTIISAAVGLAICVLSALVVSFIAGSFH